MKNVKTLWGLCTAIHEHMDDHPEHADLEVKTENNTIYVETSTGEKVIIANIG